VNEEELPVKKRKSFKEKAFQNPLVPIGKIRNLIRCKSRVCLYEEMTRNDVCHCTRSTRKCVGVCKLFYHSVVCIKRLAKHSCIIGVFISAKVEIKMSGFSGSIENGGPRKVSSVFKQNPLIPIG